MLEFITHAISSSIDGKSGSTGAGDAGFGFAGGDGGFWAEPGVAEGASAATEAGSEAFFDSKSIGEFPLCFRALTSSVRAL